MIEIHQDTWTIKSELTFETVPLIYKKFKKNLTNITKYWKINFENCNKIDSAGLSLIVQYIKHAQSHNIKLELDSISKSAISLAKVHGAESILKKYII
ncbi:hypothetical protein LO80_04915 [Candidatus Francisella endociliophora]|uniref:STAS domain-containing protein n=1 Tax=Candidatus Francisella endociliophora TaxID=653937 RepID=A0A097EP74_9GAMM|nr:STAS domain-containing protein [Francisella sp. FSC1006]AIT09371.1 hypothetical protein LO80_04915 [Francisella sp. FSC1006]